MKYRLRLARYPALAEYLQDWLQQAPQADLQRPLQLLDIGAGFGRSFVYLGAAGIAEEFNLSGIDIDPERKADVFQGGDWQIKFGNAEEPLAFADNSLDVVICEQLLEHLNHPEKVIQEVHRVLKPQGIFIVGVPTFPEPIAKLRRWSIKRWGLRGSDHIQTYSLKSIRSALAPYFDEDCARGFRVISGGILRGWENYSWWYQFNRWLGRHVPGLCIEVQLIVKPIVKQA